MSPASKFPDDTPKDHEDWQSRAPYKLMEGSLTDYEQLTGQCYCKRVKYGFKKRAPEEVKYCHCNTCQQLHGSSCQWAAIFHKIDILFYKGIEHLTFYNSENDRREYELPCKVSCKHCFTPIMDEGRNMCLIFPSLITEVKNDKEVYETFKPNCHIFYGSRVVDINDGTPKWSAHKERSDLIPEDS